MASMMRGADGVWYANYQTNLSNFHHATIVGHNNTLQSSCTNCTIRGNQNWTEGGQGHIVQGNWNVVEGGTGHKVTGEYNVVTGDRCTVRGAHSSVQGQHNTALDGATNAGEGRRRNDNHDSQSVGVGSSSNNNNLSAAEATTTTTVAVSAAVPSSSLPGSNQQQQQQQRTTTTSAASNMTPDQIRRWKRKKEIFLLFTKVLLRYLEQKDKPMHVRAKAVIQDCHERNKRGERGYKSVTVSMEVRLKKEVGETHWKRAEAYFKHYWQSKRRGITTSANNGTAAGGNNVPHPGGGAATPVATSAAAPSRQGGGTANGHLLSSSSSQQRTASISSSAGQTSHASSLSVRRELGPLRRVTLEGRDNNNRGFSSSVAAPQRIQDSNNTPTGSSLSSAAPSAELAAARRTKQQTAPPRVQAPSKAELANDKRQDNDLGPSCVICQDNVPMCIALPCAHFCFCVACSRGLCFDNPDNDNPAKLVGTVECPICRKHLTELKRVYAE